MEEITQYKPLLHAFVCINNRCEKNNNVYDSNKNKNNERSIMPSCGPTISLEDVKEIKKWICEQGWTGQVVCTKVSCLGFCNPEGGVMCIYPSGRFLKKIRTVSEIKQIIQEELGKISRTNKIMSN